MTFSYVGLTAALITFGAVSLQGADVDSNWGQWRGPLGTGEAPKADPPLNWDAGKGIKWKVKIPGKGSGTPIVWGDRIFLHVAEGRNLELWSS